MIDGYHEEHEIIWTENGSERQCSHHNSSNKYESQKRKSPR